MLYSESPSPSYGVEVDSFQLFSSRRSHNQLDARSGVWLSLWIVLRLSLPIDWEQNFPTPTSMGKSHVCHPLLLHSLRRSVYLAFFLSYASSHLVSHGTVSSIIMSFFPVSDHNTISGLRLVWTIPGNTSFFPKSTSMFQPVVPSRIDVFCVSCALAVSPGFTKLM